MNIRNRTILVLALLAVSATVSAQSKLKMPAKGEPECAGWVSSSFAKGKTPPFSFVYDGKSSDSFISKWGYEKRELPSGEDNVNLTAYIYTDPATGLSVECKVKTFTDFNAMEWVLNFKNGSDRNTPEIKNVKVIDITSVSAEDGPYQLYYADGSHVSKADFHARTKDFAIGDSLTMFPNGGRSSSHAFPFFNVKSPSGGMVVAIGWTGNWKAEITRPGEKEMNVATGMKDLATYLYPGESIRTPSTAMLLWQGDDRMIGQNRFRRFMLAHHHPKMDGKPAVYPICSSFNYGDPAPCNEYTCLTADYAVALVKRYEQFGLIPEVFWLDAGWYKKASDWKNQYNWANTVGNWQVDSVRFPNGLGEVADAVHRAGSKFMVWFEPERVMRDSDWAMEHPEFMLEASGNTPQPTWVKRGTVDSFILDLGNPEALDWLCQQIARLIRENRIDYYRQDYNLDPEGFWMANDDPGRRGICEIRYIEGLYKFWDFLREEFPGLLIDNCAGGGRRLDLESSSRSAALWRTDYNYGEPVGYQCHTYGLSMWLPVHGTGVHKSDPFTFRSSLSATVNYNWKITNKDSSIPEMQRRMAEFASVRPYFYEDYWPLTGYGDMTGDDIWLAYQLNRPSDSTGWIVAFRRENCPDKFRPVSLKDLDPDAVYVLENQDDWTRAEVPGRVLMDAYNLAIENPRGSLLIKYWKK